MDAEDRTISNMFIKEGPQILDLAQHQSACPIGLYVAQDDDLEGVKNNELCCFSSELVEYPYNCQVIDDGAIEKADYITPSQNMFD